MVEPPLIVFAPLPARQEGAAPIAAGLAAAIAHDLNNILGAVRGYADLLSEDLAEGSQQHGFAVRIAAASRQADGVLARLAGLAGELGLRRRWLILGEVAARALARLAARHVPEPKLTIAPGAEEARVFCHEQDIALLLEELVANAAEASGGKPAPAEIMIEVEEGAVCLTVSDFGEGMLPEVAARAGQLFFTTRTDRRGRGMGLAIVQSITGSLGGEVCLWSQSGNGTKVRCRLPLAAPRPPKRMVMLVSRDDFFADRLTLLLDAESVEVVVFDDAADAAAAYAAQPADWALLIAAGDEARSFVVDMPRTMTPDTGMPALLLCGEGEGNTLPLDADLVALHAGRALGRQPPGGTGVKD
jgi:hypothetical protein